MRKRTAQKSAESELARLVKELEEKASENRQLEQCLAEKTVELKALFDKNPLIMLIVDSHRRVLHLNEAAVAMSGRLREQAIGLRGGEVLNCFHADDDPRGCGFGPDCESCIVRNTVIETFRTGQGRRGVEAPIPYMSRDGRVDMWVLVTTAPLPSDPQSRVLVCLEDITERKREEEIRKQNELKFNLLTGAIKEVFWISTCGIVKMLYISPAYEVIWERSPAELYETPKALLSTIHPDDLPDFVKVIERHHRKAEPYSCELRVNRQSG